MVCERYLATLMRRSSKDSRCKQYLTMFKQYPTIFTQQSTISRRHPTIFQRYPTEFKRYPKIFRRYPTIFKQYVINLKSTLYVSKTLQVQSIFNSQGQRHLWMKRVQTPTHTQARTCLGSTSRKTDPSHKLVLRKNSAAEPHNAE